jgi:hypothetical protein
MFQRRLLPAGLKLGATVLALSILNPISAAPDRDPKLGPEGGIDSYFGSPERMPELAQDNTKKGGSSSMVVEPQGQNATGGGFADSPWKATFSQVKTKLKNLATVQAAQERVEILMEVRNVYILARRNDVLYRYNFYKTPLDVSRLTNHELTPQEKEAEEGMLYSVKVTMPFIEYPLVKKKIEAANGNANRSTVDKTMSGVDIWEIPGSMIFQWVEPYNGKPFTRTVDYMSTEMTKQILKEFEDYFDAKEKFILKFLLVK